MSQSLTVKVCSVRFDLSQSLTLKVCSVQAHQKDRVQHPNDQQQRLSLSAARWKETEGTAIDIARQARMVSRSAPVHCG